MSYDAIVVGAGFAGSVISRKLAEKRKKVLLIEKRNHIGGNAYDYLDDNDVYFHEYGPHIFHTNSKKAIEFLSEYTEWFDYEHRVLGYVQGKLVPIPFNLKSIELCFDQEKADRLKEILINTYGMESKVPILELRQNENEEIKELAEFIYENVFKYYTMKQWGYSAEEIDPKVTGRVPVFVSYDDRYFQDEFQKMPKEGYTKIFERILNHPNIEVKLNTDGNELLKPDVEKGLMYFNDEVFDGPVVYTGILDSLFDYCLGELPYRSLVFKNESHDGDYQAATTINYPDDEKIHPYTRISEYKKMMFNPPKDKTSVVVEYPFNYDRNGKQGNIPYYPVFRKESEELYKNYLELANKIPNLYPVGRLAEYKYFNMDNIVEHALEIVDTTK